MFDWIKRTVIIAVVFLTIYSGVKFGMLYYRYYAFKTDTADMVHFSLYGSDESKIKQMRDQIFEKAQSIGVPITANQIYVETTETGFWVNIEWQETVDILGQYQKVLSFEIEVSS